MRAELLQDLNEPLGRRRRAAGTPLVPPRSILLPVARHDRAVRPDLVDDLSQAEMVDLSPDVRSEEHTSELQSLMRISYAVFCLKKKKKQTNVTALKIY